MYNVRESAKRLKRLRKETHKTQSQVADEMGISVDTIRKNEQGVRGLSVDSVLMYAEYYEKSIDYIVRGVNETCVVTDILSRYSKDKQRKAMNILVGILDNLE